MIRHDGLEVTWFGYATVRIETPDGFVAYLDPGRYGVLTGEWTPDSENVAHPLPVDYDARDGDLVCVTHDHHYDTDGIERVAAPDATVVVYEAVNASEITRDVGAVESLDYDVERVGYGDRLTVGDVAVNVLPAYNLADGEHTDGSGEPIHPKGFGCGYLLDVGDVLASGRSEGTSRAERSDGIPVFWPGDSDVIPEHDGLDVSLLLPPIGGSFTMDRHQAADLAEALDPDLVLPVHYDTFAALEADSDAFAADVAGRGVPVVLDER